MRPLENVFADVDFIKRTVRHFNHADYELYKKRIDRLNLEPDQYAEAIKKLAEVMEP